MADSIDKPRIRTGIVPQLRDSVRFDLPELTRETVIDVCMIAELSIERAQHLVGIAADKQLVCVSSAVHRLVDIDLNQGFR